MKQPCGRVLIWIVLCVGARQVVDGLAAEDDGKVFSVGDLLKLASNQFPSQLHNS